MAYDAAMGQIVLFGGYNGNYPGDTWVWDGTTWTQLSPASSPPATLGASMAYDAATGQIVLFVGSNTWTWNGTTWTQQSPANSPPARSEASMTYDAATGEVVLFGGFGNSGPLNDTWTWNGTTWTQQYPASTPSIRESASVAYDAATGQIVLFGGDDFSTFLGDTWNLQLAPAGSGILSSVASMNAGTANVCPSGQSVPAPCSQSATVSFTVGASPTTVVNVNVLTQGTPNLDYTLASTTCIGLLAANSMCTVTVKFAPLFPGPRNGAITLTDSSGNLLASTLLYGTGDGPLAVTLPGTISTIAGNGTGDFSGDGGAATSAEIYQPQGLAVSADGDVYFADTTNNRIRKVTAATGVISTVAGTDYQGYFGDGGPATSAEFTLAQSVAVDGAGNVYIGDMVNNRIRKVTAATGIISTVAGNGTEGSSGDGGPATSAEIDNPLGLAVDGAGNLYIAGRDSRIRKVTAATGLISTVAGNGTQGFSGDGGAATSEKVFEPEGVAVDVAGNLFIADTFNDRVREVAAATGIITTVAGGGFGGVPGDGGPATSASLDGPFNVAVDGTGNVYITDLQDRIRKVTAATGIISTIAGDGVEGYSGDSGAATNAEIDDPFGVAVDGAGNVYISDEFNNRVRKVTATAAALVYPTSTLDGTTDSTDGAQTVTLANIGNEPLSIGVPLGGDTNPAVGADFSLNTFGSAACPSLTSSASSASSLAAGATCNLPVTFAPVSPSSGPLSESVAVTDNSLNATNATQTIGLSGTAKTAGSVAPVISNVAVPGGGSGSMTVTWTTDQPATSQVNYGTTTGYGSSSPLDTTLVTAHSVTLTGLAFGTTYDFDVVSANAASQSTTSPNAMFTTVGYAATPGFLPSAGTYTSPLTVSMSTNKGVSIYYTTDGTMPTTASLLYKGSVAVTSSETINAIAAGFVYGTSSVGSATYVINNVLGVISTYAGNGTQGYGGDGAAATSAELNSPWGTAVDSIGNLYIADWHNQRIREVTPAGVISTVAGNGTAGYGGDGGAATSAELDYPTSVVLDGSGNLYISDTGNNRIRKVTAAGVISTYAGNGTAGYFGDGGAATSAEISNARGVALDNSGNLYIADLNNMRVRKVTPSGVISTVAGNGTQGYSGDGGAATSAELNQPIGVALDTSGGLYIADSFNNRIRKVTAAGVISTVAGNGTFGYSGDGGPATSAELADSSGVAVDSSGTIYIADWQTERVRKVTPAGIISTAAGNGAGGTGGFGAYSGDGGAATSAELSEPVGVTVDSSGNLYIADLANNRIRKVTYQTAFVTSTTVAASPNPSTGGQAVTFTATVTGSGGTPTGTVTFYDSTTSLGIGTLNGSGVATFTISSLASGPHTITAVYTGDANFGPSTSGAVIEIVNAGSAAAMPTFSVASGSYVSPFAVGITSATAGATIYYTTDGSTPTTASFPYTVPVAVTSSETINATAVGGGYSSSVVGSAAYVIGYSIGIISTVAGNGTAGYNGDGIAATSAEINEPYDAAVDSSGNLYIADSRNYRVRKVTPAGVISTVAGNGAGGFSGDGGLAINAEVSPGGVAVDRSGNLYITCGDRIREVTVAGVISTVAGNGTQGYSGDGGPATSAEFYDPSKVAFDNSGNFYFADLYNYRIRKVTPAGVISTVAGNGTAGYSGDGGPSTSAELYNPTGVAVDAGGNLYIADSANSRIRKVTATGVISTVAGNGTFVYSGDGGPATSAGFRGVHGVSVDSSGDLYITDIDRIRKVTPGGIISTAAGTGAFGYTGDGGPATGAEIGDPLNVSVDSSGNFYFADNETNVVRKVTLISPLATTTTVAASPNPSTVGQAVTLTATVSSNSGPPPNGEGVFFFNNGQALNTTAATLSGGIATYTMSALPLGTNAITATYQGDSKFPASTGSVSQIVNVSNGPQVGYVSFWGINNSGITVSWSTDVAANTQLAYGTTAALGQLSPLQTALTQSHGVVLTTLNPGTTYYFVAQSTGANGATGYSTTYSFTTTGTAPAGPPVISNVMATNITNTSATITWTTDQASSSLVNYGVTNGYGSASTVDTTLVTAHSVTLTGLTLGTTYDFDVVSANSGAMSANSTNSTFLTTSVVSSPPVTTNMATTNLTSTSVTVTWTTDQPASSQVNYGTSLTYGSSSTLNSTLVTSHSVTLTGLAAGTAYDFDVVSSNAAAQSTTSGNSTFSTLATTATPPQVGYVVAWGINNSNATVTWSTDVFANTQLAYGTTTALGQMSPLQTAMANSHGVVLSGLISGTTYYFVAQSTAANGATGYSTVMSFTTTGTASAGPPVISSVLVSNITNTSATITWTTDQASSSLVNYGVTNGYGSASTLDPTLVTSHTMTLTGLTLGTTYDFDVVSANAGAMSATSGNATFMTTSVVSSPPVISNVATTNLTSTSVTVIWTTDQASSSLVNFGTTNGYGLASALNTTLVTSHSVTLSGLAAGTTYDFDVVSVNAAAQSSTSGNSTFSTLASTATPPQVGYVSYWGVNNTGITISWSTDVPANTQLAYGTTPALGQLSPLQTAMANSHGVVMTTLNPGTTYYFVAQSTGANGATGYSTTYSFTTTGTQTTPPPVISNVVATSVSNTSETITWTTDQSASSQVNYGLTTTYTLSSALDPMLVTSHSVTLTGLTPGTAYDFDVMSANALSVSSTSTNSSFTTTGTAPAPVISNVGSSGVTSGTATISWTTDQAATSVVNYGATNGYGSTASVAGLVTTHSIALTGLTANTTYNFDVVSANAANTSSTSANFMFKTSSNTAPPPVISYLDFWGVTSSGVTISWSTDVLSNTAVAYGTTSALDQLSPVQTALTSSHGVILTGLAAGTTYYFAAQSADGSGNTGNSATYSFTTLPGPPTISNVTTNPAANNTAMINWTTSVPTSSYVQYGLSTSYGSYSAMTSQTTTPHCALSYVPSGTIHYQLVSMDSNGNQVVSSDMTFTEP